MTYREEDYLQLSGLQHFKFCRRQWALIHLEDQWAENGRTVEGQLLHGKAHDGSQRERRGDLLLIRDLRVSSAALGCSGACDAVEFRRAEDGVPLHGQEGRYRPFPVEYKRGTPREDTANELQLCGQAMCLEEMLCCEIPQGALYFGQTRRRETVTFTPALRQEVRDCLAEMHELARRGHTPRVKPSRGCASCSLKDLCLPKLMRARSAAAYVRDRLEEEP